MRTSAGGFSLPPASTHPSRISRAAFALGLMAAVVTPACGQTGGKPAQCSRPEARQFVAHSGIHELTDGCQSWNYFRGAMGKWEQVWVTNAGEDVVFDGLYIQREKP